LALAGHAQLVLTGEQVSDPEAETETGPELHCAEAAEMAHWMVGGVVSTTLSVLEHCELRLSPDCEVAVQVTTAPLFAQASAMLTEPSALTV